ncbi:MAG: hypothetical protein IPI44_11770 [Sulfuritalea sp.]|nr:hypothetical protein [Sulfuritalea sp.]
MKSKKFVYLIKQQVSKISSAGHSRDPLHIVCFIDMKEEEKQRDGSAFQGLVPALSGPLFASAVSCRSLKGVDKRHGTGKSRK